MQSHDPAEIVNVDAREITQSASLKPAHLLIYVRANSDRHGQPGYARAAQRRHLRRRYAGLFRAASRHPCRKTDRAVLARLLSCGSCEFMRYADQSFGHRGPTPPVWRKVDPHTGSQVAKARAIHGPFFCSPLTRSPVSSARRPSSRFLLAGLGFGAHDRDRQPAKQKNGPGPDPSRLRRRLAGSAFAPPGCVARPAAPLRSARLLGLSRGGGVVRKGFFFGGRWFFSPATVADAALRPPAGSPVGGGVKRWGGGGPPPRGRVGRNTRRPPRMRRVPPSLKTSHRIYSPSGPGRPSRPAGCRGFASGGRRARSSRRPPRRFPPAPNGSCAPSPPPLCRLRPSVPQKPRALRAPGGRSAPARRPPAVPTSTNFPPPRNLPPKILYRIPEAPTLPRQYRALARIQHYVVISR